MRNAFCLSGERAKAGGDGHISRPLRGTIRRKCYLIKKFDSAFSWQRTGIDPTAHDFRFPHTQLRGYPILFVFLYNTFLHLLFEIRGKKPEKYFMLFLRFIEYLYAFVCLISTHAHPYSLSLSPVHPNLHLHYDVRMRNKNTTYKNRQFISHC